VLDSYIQHSNLAFWLVVSFFSAKSLGRHKNRLRFDHALGAVIGDEKALRDGL
jgi:hypothetical protein